jgi:RNA polymerase sigma-70 factor (ECF subfamily)
MLDDGQPVEGSTGQIDSLLAELHSKSGGERYGIALPDFCEILHQVRTKYLPAVSSTAEIREFYVSLRVEELTLARACAAGHERAWETFMQRYREKLYDVAAYITKESSAARELADSLYADLYGSIGRSGQRVSKLTSYTGRGSLEGWLRTVMAQEHVNRYRRQRRLVSLDEEAEEGVQFAAAEHEPAALIDPRVERAVDQVLAELSPEDRYLLASYFLEERTLAQIARSLGVHESTISRKLDRLSKSLRKMVLASLAKAGMSRRQAQEALELDVRDLGVNIRARLSQESKNQAFPDKKKEAPANEGSQ